MRYHEREGGILQRATGGMMMRIRGIWRILVLAAFLLAVSCVSRPEPKTESQAGLGGGAVAVKTTWHLNDGTELNYGPKLNLDIDNTNAHESAAPPTIQTDVGPRSINNVALYTFSRRLAWRTTEQRATLTTEAGRLARWALRRPVLGGRNPGRTTLRGE